MKVFKLLKTYLNIVQIKSIFMQYLLKSYNKMNDYIFKLRVKLMFPKNLLS